MPSHATRNQKLHILSLDSLKTCFPVVGWEGHILSPGLRVLLALTTEKSQPTLCIKNNCLNSGNSGNRCGLSPYVSSGFQPRSSPSQTRTRNGWKGLEVHTGTGGVFNSRAASQWLWLCVRAFRQQTLSQTRRKGSQPLARRVHGLHTWTGTL